jgi:polyhydroxyalkanoate synthesis regulator phasin
MATWREKVDDLVRELEQDRDELRVKAALGKAELKEELAELDAKFDEVRVKAAAWADKADDQIDDILDDAKGKTSGWMKELKEGYQKLRDRLDRDERPNA